MEGVLDLNDHIGVYFNDKDPSFLITLVFTLMIKIHRFLIKTPAILLFCNVWKLMNQVKDIGNSDKILEDQLILRNPLKSTQVKHGQGWVVRLTQVESLHLSHRSPLISQ